MHTTVLKVIQNKRDAAELGLMMATAAHIETLVALYDAYFLYTQQVGDEPYTGVLSRHDMPDGKQFHTLALTCNGIDSYISSHAMVGLMLKHELQLESEDTVVKSKQWDNVCEQLDLKKIRVIFLDEARRFIGDARDSTALTRYADYIRMEHNHLQENKDA
jgi:hypothetical protein